MDQFLPPLSEPLTSKSGPDRPNRAHCGADTSLRIIVAIGELGEPPTEAQH